MRIAVTGSHGLVGSALVPHLTAAGHTVVSLVRGDPRPGEARWDPAAGSIDTGALGELDAAVHLAGVGVAEHRWTDTQRSAILRSRVDGTTLLATALAGVDRPPAVLVSASAIGFYGDRGDEILTEQSAPGGGFLADVCRQWEAATAPAEAAGIRVVHTRTAVVLTGRGGALGRQLPLFRLGLGGRLGNGRQYTSWIAMADMLAAIDFCIATDTLSGPVNLSAPHPVTNAAFTAALGRVLHRPAVLRVPKAALALVMGSQLVEEVLVASQRVLPAVLEAAGYVFRLPDVDEGLRASIASVNMV